MCTLDKKLIPKMKEKIIVDMDFLNPVREDTETKTDWFTMVRRFTTACKHNKKNEINRLSKDYKLLTPISDEILPKDLMSTEFKNDLQWKLLTDCYNQCENDSTDRLFFAAATFNLEELKKLIKNHDLDFVNQVRDSNTVIVFVLKYANSCHDKFLECMKILIEAGVDINFPDFHGKLAVDYVAESYKNTAEHLQEFVKMLFNKGVCKSELARTVRFIEELKIELPSYVEMNNKNKLFYWIAKKKFENISNVQFNDGNHDINWDNSEDTLLQFACKKCDSKIIQCLLEKGADPNKTTRFNVFTPLEIIARHRRDEIMKKTLDHKSTIITEEIFTNFVKWSSTKINLKSFKILLESEKLCPNFVYEPTGNTPLHYAICLSHKEAIRKILKRSPTSLHVMNNEKKTPLDMICSSDLEEYFDSCLVTDRYQANFKSSNYKMLLRFSSLIMEGHNEVGVIRTISKNVDLQHVITHPLIRTFIDLKWSKMQKFFWIVTFLQGLLFLSLCVSLNYMANSPIAFTFAIITTLINIISKFFIIFEPLEKCLQLKKKTLHYYGEIFLMITLALSYFSDTFKAFAFVQMSVLLLLTMGYHPKISKWSIMLQKVFETFLILLLFFSLIILSFAAAFHLMFQNGGHKYMNSFGESVFTTFLMTVGEMNVDSVRYIDFGGYFLFFLFTMCLCLVIVNFWTGVAVSDVEKIERRAEVNAFKNVIRFMWLIDTQVNANRFFKECLWSCLLFPLEEEKHDVDFYVNETKQFRAAGFPDRVGKNCVEKIEQHFVEQGKKASEKEIFAQIEEMRKMLNDIKFAVKPHDPRNTKDETSGKK